MTNSELASLRRCTIECGLKNAAQDWAEPWMRDLPPLLASQNYAWAIEVLAIESTQSLSDR